MGTSPRQSPNREWLLTFGYFSDAMAARGDTPELLVAHIEVSSQCEEKSIVGVAQLMIEEDIEAITDSARVAGWDLRDCFWACEPKRKLEIAE